MAPPLSLVAGADGCRRGWLVALWQSDGVETRRVDSLADAAALAPSVFAVDLPIGLPDAAVRGGRSADRAARSFLGAPRGTSVFSPPARGALAAATHAEASALNLASGPDAPGLAIQAFGLFTKLREADGWVTPAMQTIGAPTRVVEVHPEVTFAVMNGGEALRPGKKSREGRALRIALLRHHLPANPEACVARHRGEAAADDVLDALACVWTAARVLVGSARLFPDGSSEPDGDGREMAIRA